VTIEFLPIYEDSLGILREKRKGMKTNFRLAHADLYVSSMEASLEFYVKHLGLFVLEDSIIEGVLPRYVSRGNFDAMRLVLLGTSTMSSGVELMEFLGESRDTAFNKVSTHQGSISFLTTNLRELTERLQTVGIEQDSEIFTVDLPHAGRSEIVFYLDPDGHPIEFIQLKKQH
jgi:catechol 2,3-dioxygenase-like lactoylglutathione lyase family enzyme